MPFGIIASVFDVVTSSLIVGRLLYYRSGAENLGSEARAVYTSLLTVFLESGAITCATRIIFSATYLLETKEQRWARPLALIGSVSAFRNCFGTIEAERMHAS